MRAPHLARGDWGEDVATRWYRDHGYEILDRNWRTPTGEIDLVAGRERVVVIVEVKTRRTDRYGPPGAAVHHAKQRRLRTLALEWLRAHGASGVEVRFDVVAITGTDVRVFTSAF